MGNWTSWVGSGAGLVAIGVAVLIKKHQQHLQRLHRDAPDWATRAVIALMFMGAAFLVITGAGAWVVDHPLHWAIASTGGWGKAAAIVGTLAVLLTAVFGIWQAWPKAASAALMLPFLLAVFNGGFFHDLNKQVTPNARHGSENLSNWLGKIGK